MIDKRIVSTIAYLALFGVWIITKKFPELFIALAFVLGHFSGLDYKHKAKKNGIQ